MTNSEQPRGSQLSQNIAVMARLDRTERARRGLSDRAGAAIADFSGSMWFVGIHVAWFVAWIVLNRSAASSRFDPYPYSLLTLIVSLEAIFLSTFVLISQNQLTQLATRRANLDLQIDLLSESEMTKVLKTLQAITVHLGMPQTDDPEMQDLSERTRIEDVVRALDERVAPKAPRARYG